ncbi:MAG: MerR family transcriptional regulator [Actinocatenispora sp.]
MSTSDDLVTIGAFARTVGLTPSALRFYADCGLLPPAHIDGVTGYRYYDPEQRHRAVLLRDLRDMDLPLPEVRIVLDGSPQDAAQVIRTHVHAVEARARAARQAASRILSSGEARRCTVAVSGPELASAVRQVSSAAATSEENPALRCVLVEIAGDEVRIVATDRYQLAVRVLHPLWVDGADSRLLVEVGTLLALAPWIAGGGEVRLEVDPTGVALTRDGERRTLPTVDDEYPRYQLALDGLAPPVGRVIVDRAKLLGLLDDCAPTVVLDVGDGLRVGPAEGDDDGAALDAICTGEPMRIAFRSVLLSGVLAASVGPDVLLDLHAPNRPVVVRSADQGTFTILAMPVSLTDTPA